MTTSLKEIIERDLPGLTLDEAVPAADASADAAAAPQCDFSARDFATSKGKSGQGSGSDPSAEAAPAIEATLVKVRSIQPQDDVALGTRTALIVNNKVAAVSG